MADDAPAGGPSIDYGEVITLFDRYSPALERYAQVKESYTTYERRLADIRALPQTGTRSFKATQARVLQEFGDGGGGPSRGRASVRRGENSSRDGWDRPGMQD